MSIKTGGAARDPRAAPRITDQIAAAFVRQTLESFFSEGADVDATAATRPAPRLRARPTASLRDLGVVDDGGLGGVAENVTVLPKTTHRRRGRPRPHRAHPHGQGTDAASSDVLIKNGFTAGDDRRDHRDAAATSIPRPTLPAGARLRILFGAVAHLRHPDPLSAVDLRP